MTHNDTLAERLALAAKRGERYVKLTTSQAAELAPAMTYVDVETVDLATLASPGTAEAAHSIRVTRTRWHLHLRQDGCSVLACRDAGR